MSDEAVNLKATFEGLALLEALRPPDGYVTDVALGTTYSVELPVALAALVSLSGTVRDTSEYGLHSAVRALDALNDRVRIAAQQGRIGAPPASQRRLAHLLDRVIRPVAFDEEVRSFHPKTWLVRYAPEQGAGPGRWCLVVGSRNLTSAVDWDLGVTLEGKEDSKGIELPALTDYVRWVLTSCGESAFGAAAWKRLPSVRWRAPGRAWDVEFGFHGPAANSWPETALATLAKQPIVRVALVSPFLDVVAVQQAAQLFAKVPRVRRGEPGRRLVAGRVDLEEVSRSKAGRAALDALGDLRCLAASPGGAAPDDAGGADDADDLEPLPTDLGLHAKAVAAWHAANDVTLLLGSANLTRRGWTGVNGEAWVRLRGGRELGEPLWAWSANTVSFDASAVPPASPEEVERTACERALDRWSHSIARLPMTLDDDAGTLESEAPIPPPPDARPMSLSAARFGADLFTAWPAGALSVPMGTCAAAARTRFVVLKAKAAIDGGALERTWVQAVTVRPDVDAQRDRAAFAEALGPSGFLALLDGILDAARADLDGDPGDSRDGAGAGASARAPGHDLSLERILRAFARRDGRGIADLRAQMSRMVAMYREGGEGRDDTRLKALWEAWDAIECAFGAAGGDT